MVTNYCNQGFKNLKMLKNNNLKMYVMMIDIILDIMFSLRR